VGVELVDRTPDRRPRRHLAEQVGLIAQRGHVRNAAATSGEHHRHLRQQTPSVMARGPLTGEWHRRRKSRRQAAAVSDLAQKVRPHQVRRRIQLGELTAFRMEYTSRFPCGG
jgi:hypothetical protein